MRVNIHGMNVDVLDADCASRECLSVGADKGTFAPGRGYTSYHAKPRAVCMTRHLHGCPARSICPDCRTVSARGPGWRCAWGSCSGVTVEYAEADDE